MADWIIIVDDDIMNLKSAGQILSKNHMRVTALRSGQALLDYLASNEFPDLILLDINMPGMGGFETLKNMAPCSRFNVSFLPSARREALLNSSSVTALKSSSRIPARLFSAVESVLPL